MKRGFMILLTLLALFGASAAAEDAGITMVVESGYGGTILHGGTYPLEVEITSPRAISGVLSTDVRVEDDKFDTIEMPVEIAANETAHFRFSIMPLFKQQIFEVRLSENGEVLATAWDGASHEVGSNDLSVGVLTQDSALADALRVTLSRNPLNRNEAIDAVRLDAGMFPANEREMRTFDVIVLDAFDVNALDDVALLENWIEEGGVLIAGTGSAEANSLRWLADFTGIEAGGETSMSGVLGALLPDTRSDSDTRVMTVRPLTPPEDGKALCAVDSGACVLASVPRGEGVVLMAGFSLESRDALAAAWDMALWQEMLITFEGERYLNLFNSKSFANYHRISGLNATQRVSIGASLLPVALLLAAYIAAAGVGLFVLARKRDRSMALWAAIPVASIAGVAVVMVCGALLGLNQPASASVTIAAYDENGTFSAEELVSLSFPNQDRVRITAQNGAAVERLSGNYFRNYDPSEDDSLTLRDRILTGEHPALELPAGAPWLQYDLVIESDAPDTGSLTSRAWIEADGLHAEVVNQTASTLREAVLITELGYATLGDIAPGETAQAFLARQETFNLNDDGYEYILDGHMLNINQNLYNVERAYVYPEKNENPDFLDTLSESERYQRSLKSCALDLIDASTDALTCAVFAYDDSLTQTRLLLDGKPIDRTAHVGVALSETVFSPVSESGYFYYPQNTFPGHEVVTGTDGAPQLHEQNAKSYYDLMHDEAFGFVLEGVNAADITNIRVVNERTWSTNTLAYYDHQAKQWVDVAQIDPSTTGYTFVDLDAETAAKAVNAQGELFLRYTPLTSDAAIYTPQIIVEGSESR